MKNIIKISKKVSLFLCFFVSLFLASGFFLVFSICTKSENIQNALVEVPNILSRSTWFSDNLKGLSDWEPQNDAFPPDYRKVDRIVIHHSAGSSDIPNPIATIQGIYRYHAVTRGWNDIGYNYIIDREGRIYEGRQGGNGVRGAHIYANGDCRNYNYGSIGIVFLGDYSTTQPPEAMYQSATKLIGWLAAVNGLDPAQTARYSMVWQDGRSASNACDSSAGGFTYNYYGPVVIGHRDVDNTACPGVIDLVRLRKESGEYAKKVLSIKYEVLSSPPLEGTPPLGGGDKGVVLGGGSSYPSLYNIQNGQAQSISNDQLSMINSSDIVEISQTQLNLFLNNSYKYSEGNLLRFGGLPEVYVVDGGKIRLFESADVMAKLGFDAGKVINLAKTDKDLYEQGLPVKYGPDGKLFAVGNTVYYIESGKKRGVTSAVLFESLGFKWGDIKLASQDVNFDSYVFGDLMRYKDDTLIMVPNIATVYRMKNQKREGFTSAEIFENLGYKWEKILKMSQDELEIYPYSQEVRYPDGFVLRQEKDATVYIIEGGKKRPFASAQEFLSSGKKWSDVLVLKTDELNNYNLAVNNSLVQDNNPESRIPNPEIVETQNFASLPNDKMASLIAPISNDNKETKETIETKETGNQKSETDANVVDSNTKYLIPNTIKIALKSFTKNVRITSIGGGFTVKDLSGNIIYNGSEGSVYTAAYSESVDLLFSAVGDSAILKLHAVDDVIIDAAHPFHSGYGGATDNVFKGNLRVKYSAVSKKCWVINELPLDEYVKGVAEISEDLPIEYLKAMSVIIRTYAAYYIDKGGKHAGEPFDLKNSLNGNGDDQVYKGYGFASRAPIFSSLVSATFGRIITFKNSAGEDKPIVAAFSSDSGGISKDARILWGAAFNDKPYLFGGIKDPDSTVHNPSIVAISHGAGLSAAGAKEMARLGSDYKAIIEYYYPGVKISPPLEGGVGGGSS